MTVTLANLLQAEENGALVHPMALLSMFRRSRTLPMLRSIVERWGLRAITSTTPSVMARNAHALAARLHAGPEQDDGARLQRAFRLVYGRPATEAELHLGLAFLAAGEPTGEKLTRWEQYTQVLLSANEFLYVD